MVKAKYKCGDQELWSMPTVDLYTVLENKPNHKLLKLTPELLEAFKNGDVTFKAMDMNSEVVLCSKDKTWAVRQKNHSNTVMLMKELDVKNRAQGEEYDVNGRMKPSPQSYLAYSRQKFELEPKIIKGRIAVGRLPIYHGEQDFPVGQGNCVMMDEFKRCSPCSEKEFDASWYKLRGCTVNGYACILSEDLLSRALHITLMSVLAESMAIENIGLDEIHDTITKDLTEGLAHNPYCKEVIRTVLCKFGEPCQGENGRYGLHLGRISQWYGICALRKFAFREPVLEEEFMIKWKSLFPPFFQCDIDLDLLCGEFARPGANTVQYLPKDTLPVNAKDRFKQLFKIQRSWNLEHIVPFIEDLNTRGINIESFVMKYARRKKQGKTVIVTAR
ncbi:HCL124Cp [Eremothecium sinecaudum]|uniref:HCL124Cp n=1 Tax=Eremothecium sinecaudum TaxID=45286 RepID=A0A109UWN0_9SACH|nr:HCL124Cp [Eremothecium sinecaudum]AMD20027.1 HCL124Cp [Eremothecium sinecaudum]